jgi:preprotein translocase subunit SecD
MLQIDLWKRVLIWALCAAALLVAMPNLFYARVEGHNDALQAIEKAGGSSTPDQDAAVAQWPSVLPSRIVNLGLDLRGGAHLLAEVHVADVYKARMDSLWPEVRRALADVRADVGGVRRVESPDDELKVRIESEAGVAKAVETVAALSRPVVSLTGIGENDFEVTAEGAVLTIRLSEAERQATDDRTMQQSVEIVRRRVDEVGTREPTIQRQGDDRILIQVPGIGSAAELKALIGKTAKLTFHPVIRLAASGDEPAGIDELVLPDAEDAAQFYVVERSPVVSGDELVDARPDADQNGAPSVSFRFNVTGARAFGDYTAENIGKLFAIVLDDKVISAPEIISHIPGGAGQITGRFTVEEATNLAVLLRAGALPAEMTFLEERTVGPELGQDSIEAGRLASAVALVAVFVFMVLAYGLFGVFASIALVFNVVIILALLSLIGATLTLPGIAGIVLTMGMAVDANVLIYERMRDEIRAGRGPARTIEAGFERALSAIIDSNLTTLLVAAIMFVLGSGPIRGFAVTLGVGIITTLFTAIFVTRLIILHWFAWRRPKTLDV